MRSATVYALLVAGGRASLTASVGVTGLYPST
jgi:hypothetical protein